MAMLAHVLQVVCWWIAPLIIFLIRRESRFTVFHALQALLLQIIYLIFVVGFMVLWFGSFVLTMVHHTPAKNTPPPLALFIVAPLLWLGLVGMWIVMLVIAIVSGIKAGRASGPSIRCLAVCRGRSSISDLAGLLFTCKLRAFFVRQRWNLVRGGAAA
jgi:uncharacterized membrane protein